MPRSPLTFFGALQLAEVEQNKRGMLDKLLGGAIVAGGAGLAVTGPLAGLGAAAVLSLVDPKNEAIRLLGPLTDRFVARFKGGKEENQYDLVVAAHTVTVLASYFDGLHDFLGARFTNLELTDKETARLAGLPEKVLQAATFVNTLLDASIPLPSEEFGVLENLDQRIIPYYHRLTSTCLDFFSGLEVWERDPRSRDTSALTEHIAVGAANIYRGRMLTLGKGDAFAMWVTLNEHAATRSTIRATQASALSELQTMLPLVLRGAPPPAQSYRAQLVLAAREVLSDPLLRADSDGLISPTVEQGFVEPAFKVTAADTEVRPADEAWWDTLPTHESIVDYLSSYLADNSSTELPLLLLGHPGAGKSLLTEVLAAQLPAESFAVVRVPLRRVNTDDELTVQITKELQRTLQRPQADLTELRDECGEDCRLVILLDGYDELIQATGITQSGYLNKIVEFQKRARSLGVPTSVIITSRTVVAEHADIPHNTAILKLCEFDEPRIDRWLTTWNAAHTGIAKYQPLSVETLISQDSIAELTRQPLLLLVMAVYLADAGTDVLRDGAFSQADLYRRILDRFIDRQVEKNDSDRQDPKAMAALQRKQLQFAAAGMFSRGRQHVSDTELNADLAAVVPQADRTTETAALQQAHRVLGAFLFVHNAQADREQRSAYEFLHATFGEYLVAELAFEQLVHLTNVRQVQPTNLPLAASQLDDLILRRVLSHQPFSTRPPIITFLTELTNELAPDRRTSILSTITELIRSAKIRPDVPDELYRPTPYDPVRRRAAYSANLTLLRVLLATEPVSPEEIIDSPHRSDWESHVRLWDAGLDSPAWLTVIDAIGAAPTADLRLCARQTRHRAETGEAELLGYRELMAQLVFGENKPGPAAYRWSEAELDALSKLARLYQIHTGSPYLRQMQPAYVDLYLDLAKTDTHNDELANRIMVLLSREAEYLPVEAVHTLLTTATYPLHGVKLAAVAATHPPTLREAIANIDPAHGAAVVAMLWRASAAHSGDERDLLLDLLEVVDQAMAALPGLTFSDRHFAPEFITYLREVQPPHWTQRQIPFGVVFNGLAPSTLRSIAPADVLYMAETWPSSSIDYFVDRYLASQGFNHTDVPDRIAVLRTLVQQD
ncbi:hypothetical protein OHA70_33040 [Kribbella sp. NBC_00382]|uniref:NACHT domain-containing protein n=1 Tax=Kribbella sp. NBC_00382 TaxID=2975967 RepID=UPI002E1E97C9